MKTILIVGLAVLACASSVAGLSANSERKATFQAARPQDDASPVVLALNDGSQCTLSGSLFRESRRGQNDIFPRSEWVMDIVRKLCPGDNGEVVSNVKWETRLIKQPKLGDSINVPGRL